jgi:5'-nucleotidase
MKGFSTRMQRFVAATAIAAHMVALGTCMAWADQSATLTVKLLAVNDFHGQLSPKKDSNGEEVGGAAYLAGYLKKAQAGKEDLTIIVDAGDHVGASPANSALLMDEPSIMFLNTLANNYCLSNKMDARCNIVATLGNHEFDKGVPELERKMNGGNYDRPGNRIDPPYLENPYSGAHYPVVSANVIKISTGKTLLPPYVIKTIRNVRIAFIGAVLKGTPGIVMPSSVAGLTFRDEAEAVNSYIPEIKAQGVHAVVVVIHQGDRDDQDSTMADIVRRLDPAVDVVISAHTHKGYAKMLKNSAGKDVLVTQAWSYSIAYADINLEFNPTTKGIVNKSADIVTTSHKGMIPDRVVQDIVDRANARVAPVVSVVGGQAATDVTATQNSAGESALGDLIADALRTTRPGIKFAFVNPGGIRANLAAGPVTWGNLFDTQPFGNQVVTGR